MTEEERRRRIEAVKESARETDQMRARNRIELYRALARLERSVERLIAAR